MIAGPAQPGRIIAAACLYYLLAFLFGFVMGILRTLVLEPRLGEVIAVLTELPVMLAFSWLLCRRLVSVFSVSPKIGTRGVMGGAAFLLLIASELLVVLPLRDMSMHGYIEHLLTGAGAAGFAGQVLFALFPVAQGVLERRRRA